MLLKNFLEIYEKVKELKAYLTKILAGEAFDKTGLIYGMGHAVYSLSDPRERVFRSYVEALAKENAQNLLHRI